MSTQGRGSILGRQIQSKLVSSLHLLEVLLLEEDRVDVTSVASRKRVKLWEAATILVVKHFSSSLERCDELLSNWRHVLERVCHRVGCNFEFVTASGRSVLVSHSGRFCHLISSIRDPDILLL